MGEQLTYRHAFRPQESAPEEDTEGLLQILGLWQCLTALLKWCQKTLDSNIAKPKVLEKTLAGGLL